MLSLWRSAARPLCRCSRTLSTTTRDSDKKRSLAEARAVFTNPPASMGSSSSPAKTPADDEPLSAIDAIALQDKKNHQIYDLPPEKDPILHFLTNKIMKHGQYSRAQKVVSEMLLHIHTMTRAPPLPIVHEAVFKVSPAVRVASSKQGGRMIMRPLPLSERQRTSQGISWLIKASDDKQGTKLGVRLAKEMIAVVKGESSALAKKELAHKAGMIARGALRIGPER